jgi:hypothetical protein
MTIYRLFVLTCLLAFSFVTTAKQMQQTDVPQPLKPWVDWVLWDSHSYQCPSNYQKNDLRQCAWPSSLKLNLKNKNGSFKQQWQVYQDTIITLPGTEKQWPQNVHINNKIAKVVERNGNPVIHLSAGHYTISGDFYWSSLPKSLRIPSTTALIQLKLNGKTVRLPELDQKGSLWLRDASANNIKNQADKLDIQVFRKISDGLPVQMMTRIHLDISGKQREVLLGKALFPDSIALRLSSPLPAKLEADGQLRIQARPGHWVIQLESRFPADISEFALYRSPRPWPRQEVWVFQANNPIRLVEVAANQIDPRQTGLPKNWQSLPAFLLKQNDKLTLNVIRRGDPEPQPDQLNLKRNLWLDFDGTGFTANDTITGSMTRGWRLETQPEMQLGRVDIDGQPQFITRLNERKSAGVEVRRGQLNLTADSRQLANHYNLSASGWQHDFKSISTVLNLPPGWKLFTVSGVDNAPDTWINKWSLLDLFLVLVLSVAIYRLWNIKWGLLALITLTLIWHESQAPHWVWVNLLVVISLLRVIPQDKYLKLIKVLTWYRHISILVLLFIVIPFAVKQATTALYPQMEKPWYSASRVASTPVFSNEAEISMEMDEVKPSKLLSKRARLKDSFSYYSSPRQAQNLQQLDPQANVQTGPGLPNWKWNRFNLSWNGPVAQQQNMKLWLMPPTLNRILNVVRILFVLLLIALILGQRYNKQKGLQIKNPLSATALSFVFAFGLYSFSVPDTLAADNTPPAEILKQLKNRLTAPAACFPDCAQISKMKLKVTPSQLTLRLEIHTSAAVFVPLPAHAKFWMPTEVTIDGSPAKAMKRDPAKGLWLSLKKGRHQILLQGSIKQHADFTLPLPLKPHHVSIDASGWSVDGVRENGIAEAQLQLTRLQTKNKSEHSLQTNVLPSFVRIERTLRLGLDWQVETRIVRLSPSVAPIIIEVPLIRDESPITDGLTTIQRRVQVNMSATQNTFSWRSVLPKQVNITLVAPDTTEWIEVWRVDVSPIWHLQAKGIAMVHHQDSQGNWLPEWRPWPGERISLNITRPAGVDGKTLTLDHSQLTITPGQRISEYQLNFQLRSSQGGQHQITLPADAKLQSVIINGRDQPIRQSGQQVSLPLIPGKQNIQLGWRSEQGIKTVYQPEMPSLGTASTNSNIRISPATDRWTLFVFGPDLGPVVLYWGILVVLIIIAIVLGRIPLTPLNGLQWFLLAIGLSQVSLYMAAFIVFWLMSLGARNTVKADLDAGIYNGMQVGLALVSIFSLLFLLVAVQQGLLGSPDMHITGNNSYATQLNWYQDRVDEQLPAVTVISVPMYIYRILMLAWALWLAFSLLGWLRWGWQCASQHGLWKPYEKKTKNNDKKALPVGTDKTN